MGQPQRSRSSGARFVLWLAAFIALSFSGGALAHQLKPSKVSTCTSDSCRPHAVAPVASVLETKRFALDAPVLLGVLSDGFRLETPRLQPTLEPLSLELQVVPIQPLLETAPRAPPATKFE